MYSTLTSGPSIVDLCINLGLSISSMYFHAGLELGLYSSDFFFSLDLSLTTSSFTNNLQWNTDFVLSGLILFLVPVSTIIGARGFKLYNQRRAHNPKKKHYYILNFTPVYITAGVFAGTQILIDTNSVRGRGVNALGYHPSIGNYIVNGVTYRGIRAHPNTSNGTVFHFSSMGIDRVGPHKILYQNQVLVAMSNYRDTGLGHGELKFL